MLLVNPNHANLQASATMDRVIKGRNYSGSATLDIQANVAGTTPLNGFIGNVTIPANGSATVYTDGRDDWTVEVHQCHSIKIDPGGKTLRHQSICLIRPNPGTIQWTAQLAGTGHASPVIFPHDDGSTNVIVSDPHRFPVARLLALLDRRAPPREIPVAPQQSAHLGVRLVDREFPIGHTVAKVVGDK